MLSIRVREIVVEKRRATYKQVADVLISELNKKDIGKYLVKAKKDEKVLNLILG